MITTDRLVQATGLTLRQIDYWARQGYLLTAEGWLGGTGTPRIFRDGETQVAIRMRQLVGCGFTPRAASRLARGDVNAHDELEKVLSIVRVGAGVTRSLVRE